MFREMPSLKLVVLWSALGVIVSFAMLNPSATAAFQMFH
jgi:hypothetical protein